MYIETEGKKTFYGDVKAIEIKNVRFPDPEQGKNLALFLRRQLNSTWVCAFRNDTFIETQRYAQFHKSLSEKSKVKIASSTPPTTTSSSLAQIAQQYSDNYLCNLATNSGRWETKSRWSAHVNEAKRRGLSCGVGETITNQIASAATTQSGLSNSQDTTRQNIIKSLSAKELCLAAIDSYTKTWSNSTYQRLHVTEAKRRGLSCGVSGSTQMASSSFSSTIQNDFRGSPDNEVCVNRFVNNNARNEAKRRGLSCGVSGSTQMASSSFSSTIQNDFRGSPDNEVCVNRFVNNNARNEAKRRGLSCGVSELNPNCFSASAKSQTKGNLSCLNCSRKRS